MWYTFNLKQRGILQECNFRWNGKSLKPPGFGLFFFEAVFDQVKSIFSVVSSQYSDPEGIVRHNEYGAEQHDQKEGQPYVTPGDRK